MSYFIAVTAIVMIAIMIVLMLDMWLVLFCFHLCSTIRHAKKETVKRRRTQETTE
jgi:hypothetical protein